MPLFLWGHGPPNKLIDMGGLYMLKGGTTLCKGVIIDRVYESVSSPLSYSAAAQQSVYRTQRALHCQ